MPKTLNQLNTDGTQFRLRVTADAPEIDTPLSELTVQDHRRELSQYLSLYSLQQFTLDTSDRFDGRSQNEDHFKAYLRRIGDLQRNRFSLGDSLVDLEYEQRDEHLLHVGFSLKLDVESARKVIDAPFFDNPGDHETITMIYEASHPAYFSKTRRQNIINALVNRVRVTELVAVNNNTFSKPIRVWPPRPRIFINHESAQVRSLAEGPHNRLDEDDNDLSETA